MMTPSPHTSILTNHYRHGLEKAHKLTVSHKAKQYGVSFLPQALKRSIKVGLIASLGTFGACTSQNDVNRLDSGDSQTPPTQQPAPTPPPSSSTPSPAPTLPPQEASPTPAPTQPPATATPTPTLTPTPTPTLTPTLGQTTFSNHEYKELEQRLNVPYLPYVQNPKQRSSAPDIGMKFYHVEAFSPWYLDTKGSRHGQLATALHNHIADKVGNWDLDVKLLDKSPFFDGNEFRNITLHAGTISLSTIMAAWLETDEWVNMWDRSDTIVSAASSNMTNNENCDQSDITARNQSMFELNDTTVYVTGYSSGNNQIHKVSVCSLSDVAVPQMDDLEDFGFITWPLDHEYRQLLVDYRPPEVTDAELEAKYDEYVQRNAPKGQYRGSFRANSYASPWLAGLVSTGRTKYPSLSSHEIVASLWTSADLSNMKTFNGNPISYSNNGAGLDYDQRHIGFGAVSINGFFDSLRLMQRIKDDNPNLRTTPLRLRQDGVISSSSTSQQRYVFNISRQATNMRMIITGRGAQSSVPNGTFFKVQIIDPAGNQVNTDARIAYDQFTASSSKVFGTKAQGQWQLIAPAGIDIQSVELHLIAVSPNGPIDQHITETLAQSDSILNLPIRKSSHPSQDTSTQPEKELFEGPLLSPVKPRGPRL